MKDRSYPSVFAWLSDSDHHSALSQLRAQPPADLSACVSCGYRPAPHSAATYSSPGGPLVVIACPSGGYAICVRCLGRDGERHTNTLSH